MNMKVPILKTKELSMSTVVFFLVIPDAALLDCKRNLCVHLKQILSGFKKYFQQVRFFFARRGLPQLSG